MYSVQSIIYFHKSVLSALPTEYQQKNGEIFAAESIIARDLHIYIADSHRIRYTELISY